MSDMKPRKKHKKDHKKTKNEDNSLKFRNILPPLQEITATSTISSNLQDRSISSPSLHELASIFNSGSSVHKQFVEHLHLDPIPLKDLQKPHNMGQSSLFNETQFLPRTFQVA
jgi:hypothetical protein